MRKLMRSMARAAMVAAGIERINRGTKFRDNWRKISAQQAKWVFENLVEKPTISKSRRKSKMAKRIRSIENEREVSRILARVAR